MGEPHRPVDKRPDFPALEHDVLERWREGRVFERSLAAREGGPVFSFTEGPPTANGDPGSHHVLLRSFKDLYLRYKTMRGYYAPRKAGWDCHGLPVELQVERELGLNSKREIETYGIGAFNEKCRESNAHYIASWERMTERVGFWIDLERAFRTGDAEYVESVWWSLHELWDRGLIYKGHKVVPYCPRCGTGLSSHEVAMAYADTEDFTATVRLPVTEPRGPLRAGDQLLIWTTQPWTLFANCAVAISPSLTYVRARVRDEVVVVAEERVEDVLGSEGVEILDRFGGRAIVDARYEPPLPQLPDHGPKGHTVLAAEHVVLDKGTGLVHTAMAFGEEDFVLCERHGIPLVNPVRADGTYDERIAGYEGMAVGDAVPRVIADLEEAGKLFAAAPYVHSYPHCWRCDSKLLYYAKESWYIGTRDERHAMLAQNQRIDWRPEHVRDGRFGNWLQGNVDWALSRDRYWGTPLPIWECDSCDARHCIGSLAELREQAGELPEDLHRPFIDDVTWGCTVEGCGGTMHRVKATIDTWYDSACMPFAQFHYPFEGRREFKEQFPPSFICEGIDQTRGWFYTSLAVSTLLFDDIPFQHAICVGHVQDAKGQKMSKSRGNAVDPWDVLETHGADAFRWYYLASQQPWAGYRFSAETVESGMRELLMPLWTTYGFYVLYANIESFDERASHPAVPPLAERPALDRWAISRLQQVTEQMRERIDAFDATTAVRLAAEWVEDLSNWYIRLSRRRFWNGDVAALATLRECLVVTAKLLAPAVPFVAEEIYANLVGGAAGDFGAEPESVHLCDYPEPDAAKLDGQLDIDMALVREAIELGRDARGRSGVKVRQPLSRAIVCGDERTRAAVGRLRDLVMSELNVKAVEVVSDVEALERPVVLPNLQRLGKRCGRDMPAIVAALRSRDGEEALRALRDHGVLTVAVATGDELDPTHTYALAENDILVRQEPRVGLVLSQRGTVTVAVDTTVEERLRREGLAREIVRVVQQARRDAGVDVTDRIELRLGGSPDLMAAARTHEGYLAEETLAVQVAYDGDGDAEDGDAHEIEPRPPVDVEGEPLAVEVVRAVPTG